MPKKRFEYTEASQGQKVNETDLANQFKGVFASGASEYRIIADVEKTDAKISVDDLKEKHRSSFNIRNRFHQYGKRNRKYACFAQSLQRFGY